jgi:hypothetical protein
MFSTFFRWYFLLLLATPASAFVHPKPADICRCSTTSLFGKRRKAQQVQNVEKQGKSRPNLIDMMEELENGTTETSKKKKEKPQGDEAVSQAELERQERLNEARDRMERRPDVSTMIVDEETGMEVVAQGKAVMDVVTRKAVKLYDTPELRLAQMFPGIPPDVRSANRMDWKTVPVTEIVDTLLNKSKVKLSNGEVGIPPHPNVANSAIDWILANRDKLGHKFKRTLGRLTMCTASNGEVEKGQELKKLWKNYLTIENHIAAPFRQILLDAEGRVGPNFGNLDVRSYCKGALYERAANYLVLKGMVAHWEKKVIDADFVEKNPQTPENFVSVLARGDPKRYLPNPPILFTLKECTQVCYMAQEMTRAFVETPELFQDLPVELRFIEEALRIKGGTSLRKFVVDEFCPAEGITPEALREGLRRLVCQLETLQIDPYGDITNILERLSNAMAVGSDDERDPYLDYNLPGGPGDFQTYTFNHENLSLVRFLDAQYERAGGSSADVSQPNRGGGLGGLGGLLNFGQSPQSPSRSSTSGTSDSESGDYYKVPNERAAGRPHNLGWLDVLNDDEQKLQFGKIPPGKVIME